MRNVKRTLTALGLAAVMAIGTSSLGYAGTVGTWQHDGIGWWYQKEDGTYLHDTFWTDEAGNTYYFSGKGYMVTGWKQINTKWYYFDLVGGAMQKNTTVDGFYWVDSEGVWTP